MFNLEVLEAQAGDCRARAIADDAPTGAEHDSTRDQVSIDTSLRWLREFAGTQRSTQASCETVPDRRRRDGGQHDEREARVPITNDVEETDNLRGVDHLRNCKAKAEEQAGNHGC